MNKLIKQVLITVGIVLFAYGIYMLIASEASFSADSLDVQAQDNTNAYITIGLGLATLLASFVAGKKV